MFVDSLLLCHHMCTRDGTTICTQGRWRWRGGRNEILGFQGGWRCDPERWVTSSQCLVQADVWLLQEQDGYRCGYKERGGRVTGEQDLEGTKHIQRLVINSQEIGYRLTLKLPKVSQCSSVGWMPAILHQRSHQVQVWTIGWSSAVEKMIMTENLNSTTDLLLL